MMAQLQTFVDTLPQDANGVIGLLQVILGALALIAAPGAITLTIARMRSRLIAECRPIVPRHPSRSILWQINLKQRTNVLENLSVLILPESQGVSVTAARIRTRNDGGLTARGEISGGAYVVSFDRFYRRRRVSLSITFDTPDIPKVIFSGGAVRRRLKLRGPAARQPPWLQIELVHERIFLMMLAFMGVGVWVIANLTAAYVRIRVLGQ